MSSIRNSIAALALAAAGSASAATAEPAIETKTQDFLDALAVAGGPPIYTLSPADARAVLEGAQRGDVTAPAVAIDDRVLPVGPTGSVKVRIFRPQGAEGPLPVVVYFHGGGWVLGSTATHDRLLRELTDGTGAAFVFVDYDRSPEAQYPVPIEQAYAATAYVAGHGDALNLDTTRLAIAGDSVGGNMAAVVAILAKQRGGPRIAQQVLFYPVTDADFTTDSYNAFAEGPWLTREAMKWFWDAYLPDVERRKEPTASPLRATLEQLAGLPPALVITDANDVLRDEGEAYAAKLDKAGVAVTQVRYLGTIHDFVMLNALAETPATRAAVAQAVASLKGALAARP